MPYSFIAALAIVVFAVAFSLQNAIPVTINFFNWTFQGSLVLVLLSTLFLGMLIHLLVSMPARLKASRQITHLQKHIVKLEHSLAEHVQHQK